MAHKVHPKSFRIKGTGDWNIRGFYGKKMPQYLEEDFCIKDYLRKKLSDLKFKVSQNQLKNIREVRMIKKDIARILTVVNANHNEKLTAKNKKINN